jgi:hypothetical protein
MGLKNRSDTMNELETPPGAPVGQLHGTPTVNLSLGTRWGKCLIVSTDITRREALSLAASEAGWDTIVCADEASATTAVLRARFEMAWIDLDGHLPHAAASHLCRSVALLRHVLLVVCGNENDPQEEIWARQLGVWLYLPGLSLDDPNQLAVVCEHAQQLTDRMSMRS